MRRIPPQGGGHIEVLLRGYKLKLVMFRCPLFITVLDSNEDVKTSTRSNCSSNNYHQWICGCKVPVNNKIFSQQKQ